MMGKHILSQKNILYFMTVFIMYDYIENYSACMSQNLFEDLKNGGWEAASRGGGGGG